ncbi:serine protease [Paenibacillus campi]|uniref:serine protease n=1 Tax=Paenibacillus campi TaxID=3106031 RepID=UPI002AFEA662|nr:serine protease [Paenibacillus sp. SGZ-1014]
MVNFTQIEKKIVRVLCDSCSERGTAFIISDRWLLTAGHVIDGHDHELDEEVTLEIPSLMDREFITKARVIDVDDNLDVALLELLEPLENIQGLKILSTSISYNTSWESFGYPKAKLIAGEKINGYVNRAQIQSEALIWDIDLVANNAIALNGGDGIEAFSGAPVIINGRIVGIILKQLEGSLAAISIKKISGFLDKNGIEYEIAPELNELPEGLNEVAKQAIHNLPVFEDLEQHIIEARRGFLLIKGSPGSGKTIINATYTPESTDIDICGKYFVRNDLGSIPVSYRASEFIFAEWLDANIHRILYKTVPEKRDRPLHEWIAYINYELNELSLHYKAKNQIGVFFIDGVDDVHHLGKTKDFFSLLPENLPENIIFSISCQTEEFLPTHLQAQCSTNRVIKIVPFKVEQCINYILNNTVIVELPFRLVNFISEKSEGHPLYLRYLVEYMNQLNDIKKIEDWIQNVPAFDGEIRNYYEAIWQTIRQHQHETLILATVSRLRSNINRASLENMLPSEAKSSFFTVFPKIQHLLVNDETISMYHSSFAMFVNQKTTDIKEQIHRSISQFCINYPEHSYAVKNLFFHMLGADEEMRKDSVLYCNQDWADKCAIAHVEPDIILEDLKQVLNTAIMSGNISKVISILLLSQRMRFRYNDIFAAHAAQLANTLIEMGRPQDAIRYLIRESFLIISEIDAVFFLHRLNEVGAIYEAEQLFKAIHLKFVNETERETVTYEAIKNYYAALTIKSVMPSQDPMYQFPYRLRQLIKILKTNESIDDSRLIEDIVAFNSAYLLWKRDMYISIRHNKPAEGFGRGISTLLCKILIHFKEFQVWGNSSTETSQYEELLKDIIYAIQQYSIDEDDIFLILEAMTNSVFEEDVITQLINKKINLIDAKFSIRKSNGVDFDYESIENYLNAWRYKGFIDQGNNYPSILNFGTSEWELYFEEILSFIGYALGKAWKYKSLKDNIMLKNILITIEQYLLPKLIVPLKERVRWDRSYALPEEFYPLIFNELASFYIEYYVDNLTQFIEVIDSHCSDQLGLYTEGFRQAMYSIITKLTKSEKDVKSTFGLLTILEKHIIVGVQNRWDRSKDLLYLAELYSRIGSQNRSKLAFQQMLDTSMGPTWYKEDQLRLLQTSITYLKKSSELSTNLKEVAGHYDFASGEITFQRYVRQVRESFIGDLCNIGKVPQAVQYFKNVVLPTPEKVIEFAESGGIDAAEIGGSYIFGAGGLEEQSCILEILENTAGIKGSLKWAYCELYLIGDDRYFDRFIKIIADLLNEWEASGSNEIHLFYRRLIKIIISDLSPDNRMNILSLLKISLSHSNYDQLTLLIQKSGIQLELEKVDHNENLSVSQDTEVSGETPLDDKDELYLPGTFGKTKSMIELGKQIELAQTQLDIENFDVAKQHLLEGLQEAQLGGWSIWSESGTEVTKAFEMLSSLGSTTEFISSLCNLILNEVYTSDWIIVNKLITSIGEKLENTEATSVFRSVLEHINFMLRTPDASIENYDWFVQEPHDTPNNILLTDLFIWLFNHPKNIIESRAPDIMRGLIRIDPNFFIPMLINKSLSKESTEISRSPEICVGILHSLAIEDNSIIWGYIQIKDIQERIIQHEHFMIKYTFLEIVETVKNNNSDANDFYTVLSDSFLNELSTTVLDNNEVTEKPAWLNHFNDLLDPLTMIGVLNKNNQQELIKYISELCLPLSIEEFTRYDIYVSRSYRSNQKFERLELIIRKGINKLMSKNVSKKQAIQVANHLRIYNPYFPKEKIRLTSRSSLISSIDELISGIGDVERYTQEGNYDYLHYLETVFCPKEGRVKVIEIIGFLVGENDFQIPFNLNNVYQSFFPNEQPNFQNTSATHSLLYCPAIYKVELVLKMCGGIMTPAFVHPYLKGALIGIKEQDLIRESWLEGRDWDIDRVGMPLREGCRLLISKETALQLSSTPWRLVWLVKYDFTYSFIIDRDFKRVYTLNEE